jgi:hypothetical protein
MKERRYTRIVWDMQNQRFYCARCKQFAPMTLPLPLDLFSDFALVFIKHHRKCKEPAPS